jgi:radical SAM protein (TIGR01212 family)
MNDVYNSFGSFLKKKFNKKIRKIPINAGFLCPNKDGSKSGIGCVFCDQYGAGPIKTFDLTIKEQIERYINKYQGFDFIAYFQAHTNTYAPLSELRRKYEIIFDYKEIVGLHIGTRPDSIAENIYPLLEEISQKKYLAVELGLQSIHEKSLKFLNRNHTYEEFTETFKKLKTRNLNVIVHLIIGIPEESRDDIDRTIQEMNRLQPAGIKLHLMHVLKNTPLYNLYQKREFKLYEREEYEEMIISILENLSPEIIIHRLTGERDREIFFAPVWTLDKASIINSIRNKMILRETFQGKKLTY